MSGDSDAVLWSWTQVLAYIVFASTAADDLMSIISSAPKLPFKINMMLSSTRAPTVPSSYFYLDTQ